ncbi:MAG: 23S rRNA (adenine(2503)-C(2))-methyltransferase RlmN [Prevotellaceae bacterium]|jgi:23S rRNA (adenine2503-C2)-methyltransferase|nr:23S rRNA (adenine(2503)-C(2))-methyltransferase RlmN [Prevotellaceae bacterium]
MKSLFGKTLEELVADVVEKGLPSFSGKQIAGWLYKKGISDISEITNLSKKAREILSSEYETGLYPPTDVHISSDGTKKYLYRLNSGNFVESVYIPEIDRATLCISSQAGCRMACRFCMTGRQGLKANLSSGEILNQIWSLPEKDKLTNVVFMGMGEPMDNIDEVLKSLEILTSGYGFGWSHKRITVSTVGILSGLEKFLKNSQCRLAVSLHSPFDEERQKLMPAQKAFPVKEVLKLIEADRYAQRRISFEYIMFSGINDSRKHAAALVKLLSGNDFRINLIRFHKIPDSPLSPSDETTMENFRDYLNSKGLLCTIRSSRGEDIFAACGMLSTKNYKPG